MTLKEERLPGTIWPARLANQVALELMGLLVPICHRIVVAGSLRRERAKVGDVELLCIPRLKMLSPVDQPSLFGALAGIPKDLDLLERRLRQLIDEGVLAYRLDARDRRTFGQLNKYVVHTSTQVPVDIFSTTFGNWGMALFVRTGPRGWNIQAMRRFQNLGMRGHAYGGVTKDGQEIACPTEEHVFDLLQWAYVNPLRRFP